MPPPTPPGIVTVLRSLRCGRGANTLVRSETHHEVDAFSGARKNAEGAKGVGSEPGSARGGIWVLKNHLFFRVLKLGRGKQETGKNVSSRVRKNM